MFNILLSIIFSNSDEYIIDQSLAFFQQIYNSKDNSESEITELFQDFMGKLESAVDQGEEHFIRRILKLLLIIIDDSEKKKTADIESLLTKKKGITAKFIIINETIYSSDSMKKIVMNLSLNTTLLELRKMFSK